MLSEKPTVAFVLDENKRNIYFNATTEYELIDKSGQLIRAEKGKIINLHGLDQKKYVLRYDNTYEVIKLKWNK
jgi:hypothetical protein